MICDDISIIFEALPYEIHQNGLGTTLRQKSKVRNWKESKIQMIVNCCTWRVDPHAENRVKPLCVSYPRGDSKMKKAVTLKCERVWSEVLLNH